MFIYFYDGKAEFSASFLHSLVSHDPSEIILICWFGAQLLSVVNGSYYYCYHR